MTNAYNFLLSCINSDVTIILLLHSPTPKALLYEFIANILVWCNRCNVGGEFN